MSPAQAELEDNQAEIEKLRGELAACRLELSGAIAGVDMARETIGMLKLEVEKAREETVQVYAAAEVKLRKLRDQVRELQMADGREAVSA